MKKLTRILTIVLALCLALSLAACGDPEDSGNNGGEESGNQGGGQAANTGYTFTLKGVEIAVDADLAPIVEALGEATSYFESESCAFQGLDKVWTYGGVILRSYPEDGKDLVLSVELKDDSVSTPEGVYIGSAEADVKAAYGEPATASDTACVYTKGGSTLTFILDGGKVTGITYTSDVLSD